MLLGWFAGFAEPDAALLAFRQVSEALGDTPWYLRLLRDETKAAERMAHVLASSRYATGLLLRAPEAVTMFGADTELEPRSPDALRSEMMTAVRGHPGDPEAAVAAIRSLRRRELLRTAAADILGVAPDLTVTGEALTSVTQASVRAALAAATSVVESGLGGPLPTRFAVIAMGRFGGHETGYGSDADVLFVHDPLPGAGEKEASDAAHAVAVELRRLLALPVPDPQLIVDADLRPEGRQGPLVRTLASYQAYYRRWSAPWEAQALLRAEPVAGDAGLGAAFTAMIDEFRYPGTSRPSGSPGSGSPASGSPGSGSPASGSPGSGSPASGSPGSGSPASGSPGSGSPASGSPGSGSPASGSSGRASPCSPVGSPGSGLPGTDSSPGTGSPGSAVGSSGPASPGARTGESSGIDAAAVREIRRIKARMEAERIPRGADPALHVKLGPGGLSDVEWTVQLLQLRHAHAVPALRTTRTTAAMAASVQAGLLSPADAAALMAGWSWPPGSGTPPCWYAAVPATRCRPGTANSPPSPGCSATHRVTPPRHSNRTTAAPPAAPAP